jgi:hypothetical protein
MTEVTTCQLLLASFSLSGPIRFTTPCNSVTVKSLTVPLGISTSVLRLEGRAELKQLFVAAEEQYFNYSMPVYYLASETRKNI